MTAIDGIEDTQENLKKNVRDGEWNSVCTSLNECLKAEDDGLEDTPWALGTHG